MKRAVALLTVILVAGGCSAVRGTETETNFGSNQTSSLVFEADAGAETEPAPAIQIGDASVSEPGAASTAIDFVSTELYSRSDIDGRSLFGGGSVIATFVQPGCEFSSDHAELLAAAADKPGDVTYVFVHSGAASDAFTQFVVAAGIEGDNIVHLDDMNGELSHRFGVTSYPSTLFVDSQGQLSSTDGALNATRLNRALAIVTRP